MRVRTRVRACVYALRIVSTDKILRFINILIITIINFYLVIILSVCLLLHKGVSPEICACFGKTCRAHFPCPSNSFTI